MHPLTFRLFFFFMHNNFEILTLIMSTSVTLTTTDVNDNMEKYACEIRDTELISLFFHPQN